MDKKDIEELQEKIEDAKQMKAKAEGAIEQILLKWKKEYDCDTFGEVEKLVKDYRTQLDSLTIKYNTLVKEIEVLIPEDM